MTELSEERGRRRRRNKWAAIGLILLLEVGAVVYLNASALLAPKGPAFTFTFPTSTTTTTTKPTTKTTGPPPNSVVVKSAIIFNDTLSMDVKNTGTVWTKSLTVFGTCTPDFKSCFSGHSITKVFTLAPKSEYMENISGICVVPLASCTSFKPVVNFTYYLGVSFAYASGSATTVPVSAMANNTFPLTAAVQGLTYQLVASLKNGTGSLTINLLTNSSISSAKLSGALYTRSNPKGAFSIRLLYNKTGCGGNYDQDCSSGEEVMIMNFSTVETGIGTPFYPPPHLLSVSCNSTKGTLYFAVWVPTVNETA